MSLQALGPEPSWQDSWIRDTSSPRLDSWSTGLVLVQVYAQSTAHPLEMQLQTWRGRQSLEDEYVEWLCGLEVLLQLHGHPCASACFSATRVTEPQP